MVLDFLYQGKRPGRLTQPTHGVYLRKAIFRSLLSRKAALVMTIISDLSTLILKLRAQLLASPWQQDPGTGHVTHPLTSCVILITYSKNTLPFSSHIRCFGKRNFLKLFFVPSDSGLENVLGVTGVCWT